MNKILEEFKRIKTERNKFIDETNRKGEILLSQAKNKFDSMKNSNKNMNNKKLDKKYEYLETIKMHLKKAINLKEEIYSYNAFFNKSFQDLILFLDIKIKEILNKNNENMDEEEENENFQDIIKLAQLTKMFAEENMDIIKSDSNPQKQNILMQLKENLNIINNNLSPNIITNNNIKNNSIIDKLSKVLNHISDYIIFIYNDINSINFNNNNDINPYISNYLLNSIFINNLNINNNINNSKIWKLIITKNNNQEITFTQSNFKTERNKKVKKYPKNYSIKIYIEKVNNAEKIIKLIKYILSYIKNKIMNYYVITNNLKCKKVGYYYFQIFGIGKRKKKIIQKIKNLIDNINNKTLYNNINVLIKASLYDDIDILLKNKFFKLLKNEFLKLNDKKEENNSIININDLINLVKNNIHYNFDEDLITKYLNLDNIFF